MAILVMAMLRKSRRAEVRLGRILLIHYAIRGLRIDLDQYLKRLDDSHILIKVVKALRVINVKNRNLMISKKFNKSKKTYS